MVARQPKSRAYYRVNATRQITAQSSDLSNTKPTRGSMTKMSDVMKRLPARVNPRATRTAEVAIELETALESVRQELQQEQQPTVGFAHATYAVIESAGTVTVQLKRKGALDFPLAVAYATKDDTAVAPEDYVAAAGVLEFEEGQDTAEITITIIDDDIQVPPAACHRRPTTGCAQLVTVGAHSF